MAVTPAALGASTPSSLAINEFEIPYLYVRTLSGSHCPGSPPFICITNTAAVQRLAQFFSYYYGRETTNLWSYGLVNQALGSINIYLRYNKDSDDLELIQQIAFELTSICTSYVSFWTSDPILCQLRLDIDNLAHPAWNYYRTLFATKVRGLVTTADGQKGILISFYTNLYNETTSFTIEMLSDQAHQTVVVHNSQMSAFTKYLLFE
jgi:hypothetical protein